MKRTPQPRGRFATIRLRRFASLSSALAVTVVAGTGILGFVSAAHVWVLAVHTVVGFAFVAVVALHAGHNARPLAMAAVTKQRRGPSFALGVALALVVGAGALAYADARPVRSLLAWGKEQRQRGQPPKTTYTTIVLDSHGDGPTLSIDLKAGPSFRVFDPELGFDMTPQIAIWVEDEEGRYVETLYVTHSEAKSDYWPVHDGQIVRRPEALPVWGHARGVKSDDGVFAPTSAAPLPDAITAASPLESAYFVTPARTALSRFVLLVEVSNASDFNDYYGRKSFPDDPVYSGDGYPAQPSAVYRGVVDTASSARFVILDLAGHGHVSGRDGKIDPDVSHMTTGLQIVDRILVEVRKS
jgi:hypothetical protein